MNDKFTNDTNSESENIARTLTETAGKITLTPNFAAELEQKLRSAHRPRRLWFASSFKQVSPTLGWIALIVLFGLALNWSIRTLIPAPQPAAGTTPTGFICPVTEPNGSTPPFENPSPSHHGNGEIWTGLWPDGKVYMLPDNQQADGSFSMKWWFWRNSTEPLSIEGHRLDIESDPLRVFYTGGYNDSGIFIVALIFPATGCWEVTARVGESSLTFVTEVVFGVATPTPNPVMIQPQATPIPDDGGYDWRGTKLYLAQSLPNSSAEADVYLWKSDKPATIDDARALAQQFGINGEPGETPGEFPGNFDYLVVEGTRRLRLRADHYFTYHSNFESLTLTKPSEEQARSVIDDFLKSHGFDFEYRLESAPDMQGQHYSITPLTPDGFELRFDYMMPVRYDITLDDTGENIILAGYRMNYESLGNFGIVSVDEALQKILDPNPQTGLMEIFRGHGGGGGGSSFLQLNLSGTPVPFPNPTAQPEVNLGSGDYTVKAGDTLNMIAQTFGITTEELMQANGLTEPMIFIDQKLIIPGGQTNQRLESLRGFLFINLHKAIDGTQTRRYLVAGSGRDNAFFSYQLEGSNLNELDAYIGLPIIVTGTIRNANDTPVIQVEEYKIPFPDLQFQIVRGTQKRETVNGQPGAIVFTTEDGRSYVEFSSFTNVLADSLVGRPGDLIQQEVLIVPDDTFGGLPVMHVYQGSIVNQGAGDMQIQANQVIMIEEKNTPVDAYIPPIATIEKVDLVYYVRYPLYALVDPSAGTQYLQPAWRFHGHYSSGEEFEILVQALKQEFLLPELAPYTPPG